MNPAADIAIRERRHHGHSRLRSHRHRISGLEGPQPDPVTRNHFLDTAIEFFLAALLAFAPFAFGSVEAWSEAIVIAGAALIGVCFCLKILLVRDVQFVRTWAYLPLGLFLALTGLQLAPLPARVVSAISPHTMALRSELLGNLPNANEALRTATLTFYPAATRHDLRLLFAVSTVFVVVLNTYRRPEQIKRLLVTVILIGAFAAALAFAQDITGATNIYWIGPAGRGAANAGPFVSYSHYAQFMNLSMGAGIGLLLVTLHKSFTRQGSSPAAALDRRDVRIRTAWLVAAFIILGAITVFLSGSRGAMVGWFVSLTLGTLTLSRTRGIHGRAWLAIPLALIGCSALLFLGPSAVYNRFATLESGVNYQDRLQIVKDLTVAWRQFPVFGTGLGSHEVVYPMFENSTRSETFTHAENEYAQIMEETGAVGLILVFSFIAVIASNYKRATDNADPPIRLAAVGLGIGLVAIFVHSLSDFGQHLPANAMLSAVFCGLLVSLGRIVRPARSAVDINLQSSRAQHFAIWRLPLRMAAMSLPAAAFTWALFTAFHGYQAESHWRRASALELAMASNGWNGTNNEYADLLAEAAAASNSAPDNALYRYSLNAYRWHALSRVHNTETGELVVNAQGLVGMQKIVVELGETRRLCPTYARTYCLAAQLETSLLNDHRGPADVRSTCKLGNSDPWAWGSAAALDVADGHLEDSLVSFRRYLQLGGSFQEVIRAYVTVVHRTDLALGLVDGNAERLSALSQAIHDSDPSLSQAFMSMSLDALRTKAAQPDAPLELLVEAARAFNVQNDRETSIRYYRRAVALNYGDTDLHMALANLLSSIGQIPEALHETEVCLRLSPGHPAATALRNYLRGDVQSKTPLDSTKTVGLPTQPQ